MSVIATYDAETFADADEIAGTRRKTPGPDGGVVPAGLAGYVYAGAVYCPECAGETTVESSVDGKAYSVAEFPAVHQDYEGHTVGIIECIDEWDYPGAVCHDCGRTLATNVTVYDRHGAHPTPVVSVRPETPGQDLVVGGVVERGDDELRVLVLDDHDGTEAGDIVTVDADRVVGTY